MIENYTISNMIDIDMTNQTKIAALCMLWKIHDKTIETHNHIQLFLKYTYNCILYLECGTNILTERFDHDITFKYFGIITNEFGLYKYIKTKFVIYFCNHIIIIREI